MEFMKKGLKKAAEKAMAEEDEFDKELFGRRLRNGEDDAESEDDDGENEANLTEEQKEALRQQKELALTRGKVKRPLAKIDLLETSNQLAMVLLLDVCLV